MSKNSLQSGKVAFISMPWALYNRPSVQLGALKAYIELHSEIQVDTFHPYLHYAKELGLDTYQKISLKTWAGEALFGPLIFPDNIQSNKTLFEKKLATKKIPGDFSSLHNSIRQVTDSWLDSIDFSQYIMVGFTICFDQLLSSLYAAQEIKARHPHIKTVFGGSSCCGQVGQSLLDNFDQIDFLIDGEGEQQVLELVEFLLAGSDKMGKHPTSHPQLNQLDVSQLPRPDYHAYFTELKTVFPGQPFQPLIPLEFSRGCWWSKCSFCNLNIQWCGYRFKKAEQVAAEVSQHCYDFAALDFCFTDNALPPKEADRFFEAVSQQPRDFSFFAEIRAITSNERIKAYRKGGLTSVQIGIEALSDSLLTKMVKGTRTIDNIAIMKYCTEHGVKLDGNLITHFPSSTAQEVADTLEALEFALPFNPLSTARFFLGYGSPVYQQPKSYGITPLPHPINRQLFPKQIMAKLTCLIQDYRGDKQKQEKLWKAVREKVKQWRLFHENRTDQTRFALSYREGGSFIIIRQERTSGPPLRHTLKGVSRELYLFCMESKTVEEILEQFPSLSEEKLFPFLQSLHQKRILFFNNQKALALAIHQS